MKRLPVSAPVLEEIKAHLAQGRKINAIKALRNECDCGLRDAKHAVEHLMGEITAETAGVTIGPYFRIKSFQLECSDGVVEVDMEELKLKFLMELPEIGIDACGKLLELTEFVQKWQGNG